MQLRKSSENDVQLGNMETYDMTQPTEPKWETTNWRNLM